MTTTVFRGATCLPYELKAAWTWKTDPAAGVAAFFVGAVCGVLVGLLCAYLCLKDIFRSKSWKNSVMGIEEDGYIPQSDKIRKHSNASISKQTMETSNASLDGDGKVGKKVKKRHRPGTSIAVDPSLPIGVDTIELGTRGLCDALLLPDADAMTSELSEQDLKASSALNTEHSKEKANLTMQVLRVLLQQCMMDGKMENEEFKNIMRDVQDHFADAVATASYEKEDKKRELRKKYEEYPDTLDVELDKLEGQQMSRIITLLEEKAAGNIRMDVRRNTNLSEEDLDQLMADLNSDMADSEMRLSEQRARQAQALEERLTSRKQLAEMHQYHQQQQQADIQVRHEVHAWTLDELVKDGKMSETQKEAILAAYANDQHNIYLQHEEEMQKQQLHLAKKLTVKREKKIAQLNAKQEQERQDVIQQVDTNTNTQSVKEILHRQIERQHVEWDEVQKDLDLEEANQFSNLLKKEQKQLKGDLETGEENLFNSLQSNAELSKTEAKRIMARHEAEMSEYARSKNVEKQRMQARMAEKLEQRRQRAEEEAMLAQAELVTLVAEQTAMVRKVLDSQVQMHEDDKERILREHEQNMAKVNNQLTISKLHQQKALEQRLSKRRARLGGLRAQRERLRQGAGKGKKKERERLAEQLEKQIKDEEEKLEHMRKKELDELRMSLATETAEALTEQEKRLGLLIGKLQVGQARRQAVIARQDKVIKELESKMVDKVVDEKEDLMGKEVNGIIKQYSKQLQRIEDQFSDTRDRQESALQERLQAKKLMRQKTIERELEKEADLDEVDQRRPGTGLATSILGHLLVEQRHKVAMERLARDMQQDLRKQCDELDAELQQGMQAEFAEQRKSFLAGLAAISNMSKEAVSEVVDSAVADAGGDERQARKLTKEMSLEIQKARAEIMNGDADYSPARTQSSRSRRRPSTRRQSRGRSRNGSIGDAE